MGSLISEEQKLAKYLLKKLGLSWEGYLKRFENTAPLEFDMTNLYPFRRLSPEEVECEIDLIVNLSSPYRLKRFDKEYKIIAGFKKKVTREEVEKLDYIHSRVVGLDTLFHQRVIDIMLKICPYDFQPIPVTLISSNKHIEPFEIKSFYAINVLKCIDAIDQQQSIIDWSSDGEIPYFEELCYKENPWQDGCTVRTENHKTVLKFYQLAEPCMLAIEATGFRTVWHPKLAKEMPYSSLYSFKLDVETTWLHFFRYNKLVPKLYEELARLDS